MNVLITGATRGLGKAIAEYFDQQADQLFLIAKNGEGLELFGKTMRKASAKCYAVDLSSHEEIERLCEELKSINRIDVLVNNVGVYKEDALDGDLSSFDKLMNVNVNAAVKITHSLLEKMKAQKSGYIFNICSVLSRNVRINAASYTIAKHALKGFNDLLRLTVKEHNIKVTAIYPAAINTSSWDAVPDAPREQFIQVEDLLLLVDACLKMSKNAVPEEIVMETLSRNM